MRHTYKGALEIALDTSSTFSSIVWKLPKTKNEAVKTTTGTYRLQNQVRKNT